MPLNKTEIRALYGLRARHYDFSVGLYALAGFRLEHYRRLAIEALQLRPGDTAIDLACGTGLNLPRLRQAVGETGRVIGVDMTDAMLNEAQLRIAGHGWQNVELVHSDIAEFKFPWEVAGILSTYAITLVPEFDDVIHRGAEALHSGGRLAVLDFKLPQGWPDWLVRLGAWIYKPYGVSIDLADRHPWESIRRYLQEVAYQEFYFGGLYLSVGMTDQEGSNR